jgi:subtilisin family serine protease
MRFNLAVPVFALCIAAAFIAAASRPALDAPGVRFVAAVDPSQGLQNVALAAADLGFDARPLHDLHAVEVTAPASALDAIAAIAAIDGVRYAEPVVPVRAADIPADGLFNTYQSGYLGKVTAPAAWDIEKGNSSVIIAVVDTGVDVTHPDLAPNIWFNAREIPNNGVDDDNNGCVDDVNGCAFVSDSAPGCQNITNGFIRDDIGHGTFVAGVAAAAGNGQGMVGVARNARIMPVKVLDCYGSGDSVATARGILYAARNGARIINLSLGGLTDAQVVRDAVAEVMSRHNALVIAASGNFGTSGVAFPARIGEVLAVGATNPGAEQRSSFSSYGPEIDVVAVGQDVVGTLALNRCVNFVRCIANQPYAQGDGTSFSTPQVSGLAALILSRNPNLSPWQLTDLIKNAARSLAPANTPGWAGAGRIDMAAALKAVRDNRPPGDPCTVQSVQDGESFTCSNGARIRLLQIDAPDLGQCGGQWAFDALRNIFLTPGRQVYLRYDYTRVDPQGRILAAPLWRGNDGADYNISIIMAYVGLARAADIGNGNLAYSEWSKASESWARALSWNMWAPNQPFTTGC